LPLARVETKLEVQSAVVAVNLHIFCFLVKKRIAQKTESVSTAKARTLAAAAQSKNINNIFNLSLKH